MNTAEKITVQIGKASVSLPAADVMAMVMQEVNQHSDDKAVNEFAAAMRTKMKFAREVKGRTGWDNPEQCSTAYLNESLVEQVLKGDSVDLANFAMMLYARGEVIKPSLVKPKSNAPRIGHFWQGQGGFYAGIMRGIDGQPDYHLIVSSDDLGEMKDVEWGCQRKEIAGASNYCDGPANTKAMADNGSDLAKQIIELEIDDHKDWYLPARKEARLCFVNCQDQFEQVWYWTSTQYSANGAFFQHFEDGGQGYVVKDLRYRARAVRRLSII